MPKGYWIANVTVTDEEHYPWLEVAAVREKKAQPMLVMSS